jgi:hypothetical protein
MFGSVNMDFLLEIWVLSLLVKITGRWLMFWSVSNDCFLSIIMIIIGSPPCYFDMFFHVRFIGAVNSFFFTLPVFNQLLLTDIILSVGDCRGCPPQLCPR